MARPLASLKHRRSHISREPHVPFRRGPSPQLKGAKSSHYWKKGCLVCQLKAATHPQKGTSRLSKTQVITRANTRTRSTRRTKCAYHELEPVTVPAPEAVLSFKDSEEEPVETHSNLDDPLVEDFEETTHNTGNSFTPAQIATIESTVQSFMDRTLQSFSISANLPFVGVTPPYSGTSLGEPEQQLLWACIIH